MIRAFDNTTQSAPPMDLDTELANQTQRLYSLEQELERLNRQFKQNQQYTAALEVDFEHLLTQLQYLQCSKKLC
jgi:hypothetical protein